jgi:hypothetical protein
MKTNVGIPEPGWAVVAILLGCQAEGPLESYLPTDPVLVTVSAPAVAAPSNLTALASSQTQIDINWQDNSSNETKFEVHRSATLTGSFTLQATTSAQVTGYSDQGLEPSSQYCYKVRAARVKGSSTRYSAFSNTVCATTPAPPPPPPPPPPAPAAASGTIATPSSSSSVTISWTDNSSNEDGFRIDRSIDGGTVWNLLATAGASPAWNLPAVAEQPMCYRVVAFNAGGEAAPSNTACTTPPAGPTNAVVTSLSPVALSWTDNSAVEDGYQVRLFQTNCIGPACPAFDPLCENYGMCDRTILIAELPANTTAYTGPNPADVFYSYNVVYVVAMRDGGNSDASDPRVDPRMPLE